MKTIKKYCLLLAFITNYIYSQSPNIIWEINYGLPNTDDSGQSVLETSDGGIAVAGYTASFGAGGNDVLLIKTDADGNVLWSKTYGGLGDDYAYSMKQTDDGGFIIGGATNSFGSGGLDYYLIKTDSLGDTLWTKTFGGVNDDICWGLEATVDGYVLAGGKNSNLPFHPDIWLVKTSQFGLMIWEKTYGNSGDDVGFHIDLLEYGNFLIAGKTGLPTPRAWLLKLNSSGDTLWTKKYGESYDSFRSSQELQNSKYIITGMRGNGTESWNVALLKTDSLGNVEWEKTYDYDNDADIGYSVQQTSDGGYSISGQAFPFELDSHAWIIRTNSIGDTLWTKTIKN